MQFLSGSTLNLFAVGALCLVVGTGAGWLLPHPSSNVQLLAEKSVRIQSNYPLISPLLMCGTAPSQDQSSYTALNKTLTSLVANAKSDGQITQASIYFRRNLDGISINETEKYAPASLLKVPVMIAYFSEAEKSPSLLQERLAYDGKTDANLQEHFKSQYLQPGSYTVDELITAMIVHSDNNAFDLLVNHIDQKYLLEIFSDLGVPTPQSGNALADFITPQQYSHFFRVLYNATYLDAEYSSKALTLLSKSDFPNGIQSALPSTTTVAQKFGERSFVDATTPVTQHELHDCGLIYDNNKPYFLCVMTKGTDFDTQLKLIQDVSKEIRSSLDN